jgi:hypothetical protein
MTESLARNDLFWALLARQPRTLVEMSDAEVQK